MKNKKEKYRIVEFEHKFYIEELVRIFWWKSYLPITKVPNSLYSDIIKFDTIDDAKHYILGLEKKYHYL
jgi:hypothetical protein